MLQQKCWAWNTHWRAMQCSVWGGFRKELSARICRWASSELKDFLPSLLSSIPLLPILFISALTRSFVRCDEHCTAGPSVITLLLVSHTTQHKQQYMWLQCVACSMQCQKCYLAVLTLQRPYGLHCICTKGEGRAGRGSHLWEGQWLGRYSTSSHSSHLILYSL